MEGPFWDTLGLYFGVILTFSVFSYLWRENFFFRMAEHIFVGLAASWSVVNVYHNYMKPIVQNDIVTDGKYGYLLLMAIGLLMYTRLSRNYVWLSRIPIALQIGYNVGYGLAIGPRTYLRTLNASFVNIIVRDGDKIVLSRSINQFLFFFAIVTVLSYFIFTMKTDKGVLKVSSSVGRWTMMIAFGAAFGNTISARMAVLVGRLQFLLGDWLGII